MSLHCPRSGLSPLPLLSTPSLSLGCLGFLLILILGRMAHRNTPSFSPGEVLYRVIIWPVLPETRLSLPDSSYPHLSLPDAYSAPNGPFKRVASTGLLRYLVLVACPNPPRKLLSPHLGTAGFLPPGRFRWVFIRRVSLRVHLLR